MEKKKRKEGEGERRKEKREDGRKEEGKEGKNNLENGQSVSRNPREAELFPSRVAQVIWHS